MYRAHRVVTAALATGVAAAITLTGCSSDSDGGSGGNNTATSQSNSDPAALVNAAADKTAALTGAHLNLTVDGKVPNVTAKKVDADLVAKPATAAKGTATVLLGTTEATAPFVYVDKHLYADIGNKGYVDYGDGRSIYDVSAVLNPEKGLANLLRNIQNPKSSGLADVDGTKATRITGTVAAKVLAPLTGTNITSNQDAQVPVNVWITSDNQLARVVLIPATDAKMTINLSNWNNTVEVAKPSDIATPTPSSPPNPADASRVPA
ncbi:LppX_LprAFG lipoprotein [Gordonia sp. DT30]|uniref:LppX_LprAFG lipoprotein n=1 Tax=Gordonia sp. DT30 TaxID=3416546 RepID=UPI003CF24C0B